MCYSIQMNDTPRPTWAAYFISLANNIASRSTCLRRNVGSVIAVDNRIVSTGYNGVPSGIRHCLETGCIREKENIPSGQQLHKCLASHAEANAITQAARFGVSIDGATLYCTTQPCTECSKLIVQSGIRKVVYQGDYPDTAGLEIMREGGVEVQKA